MLSVPYWPCTDSLPAEKLLSLPPAPSIAVILPAPLSTMSSPAEPVMVPVPEITFPVAGP